MKTIMDAVNELHGNLSNSYNGHYGEKYLFASNSCKHDYEFITSNLEDDENGDYQYVCTTSEFNALVSELQNWQPTKKPKSKFERDVEVELFGQSWVVGIIYDSFDTLHEFDIQELSLKCYPSGYGRYHLKDLTTMLDSCPSLNQQFECAVIAKIEEERQNV